MLDPARRDDQSIEAWRVEREAQRRTRHGYALSVGRSPQLLDRRECALVQIGGTSLGRMGQAASGRRRLADPVFAREQPAGERAERGITQAVIGAVWDQRLGIRGGE